MFLDSLFVGCLCFHSLYAAFFLLELYHGFPVLPNWLPDTSTWFPECRGGLFLCLRMLSSKANQLYWDPSSFRVDSHGIPPVSSLNDSKSALLKPSVCALLLAFLPHPPQELDSTISWSQQHHALSIGPAWPIHYLCNKKLSLTPSSNLLDVLNFPVRMGVCDIETSSGCSEESFICFLTLVGGL